MPTLSENARAVLDIYAHFNSRAGQVLLANNFVAVAARRRIPISDVQMGIEYASGIGWIEKTSQGLMLTAEGERALACAD